MPNPLIECVPNFSEARRPEVVEAIFEAIKSVSGVRVLDRHSDTDHNRTVITFVGPPEAAEQAAFRGIAKAAELIDLNQHSGEHPRIGAADVVPFVPISGVTMEDCVEIARRLGRRVGEELGIPVYLYERAASRSERKNLENIRRGEYEILKEEIGVKEERQPDFGPAKLGPAGATVIGARPFLIAYNVYLTTDEVSIADKIARAVRHSSGGLRYVKALGLLVEGRAQVSMNLTDFRKTPLARVVETIRREAQRYGVAIHHSELVGLIPMAAVVDAAVWYTQMDQFEADQILETKLFAQGAEVEAVEEVPETPAHIDFLERLASGSATPGGGSASAYAGSMAAALVAMVARLTIGKKKYAEVEQEMKNVVELAEALRASLSEAVARDAMAFEAVMAAYKLPKHSEHDEQVRAKAIEAATLEAARVPLDVADDAVKVMELALQVVEKGNINAITDGGTAAYLALTAVRGCALNVRVNLATLKDRDMAQTMVGRLEAMIETTADLEARVNSILSERGGLPLE
jgi:glutamate formiminotransferase/formiminotetrahydrofolate cyclodeaminase